ncbi:MAG: PQQ-binding-like beta-propeller repeat protein [bacterium]|jgi:outer membrane protein assembly factor BamB
MKSLFVYVLIFLSSLRAVGSGTDAVQKESEWHMFRGGQQQLGMAAGSLPPELSLHWTFQTGGPVKSSAVVAESKVFVGSHDKNIYALELDSGNRIWAYETEDIIEAPPMYLDGRIIVGSADGFLYCLDAGTGELIWRFETTDQILGSANWVYSPDRENKWVVFGSYDGRIYCVDFETGELNWHYGTQNYINGSPAISDDTVAAGGCDAFVYRLSAADGRELGALDSGAYIAASIASTGDRVYIGNYGNEFLCIDLSEQQVIWRYKHRNFPYFSSAAVTDHLVVFGGRDRLLHCVKRDTGEGVWTFRTRGKVDSSPVICGDEVVVGSEDGRLYRIRLSDGSQVWSYEIGEGIISSPAVAGGKVVIGADDGRVYLFGAKAD